VLRVTDCYSYITGAIKLPDNQKVSEMAKQFDVETETSIKSEFNFRGAQEENFNREKCDRVFQWRDVRGDVRNLPNYVCNAISGAGYRPVYLGGTTYKYSVIGLIKVG
jgi:hypothetical protein